MFVQAMLCALSESRYLHAYVHVQVCVSGEAVLVAHGRRVYMDGVELTNRGTHTYLHLTQSLVVMFTSSL